MSAPTSRRCSTGSGAQGVCHAAGLPRGRSVRSRFACCCPRPPARAARWPHPQRVARARGPPQRCRVEARAARRPGETRRYPLGRPHPAPAGRCAPYSPHLQRCPSPHPHRPVESAPAAQLTRSTGRWLAPWAAAVGRAAAGKAAAEWRPVPAAVRARRPVPTAVGGGFAAERSTAAEVVPTSLADLSGCASSSKLRGGGRNR